MSTEAAKFYEEDFYAWTRDQAASLRRLAAERWNGPLDLEHLAEEIEDVGSERRFAVESHLGRVMEHLLKLEHSPSAQPRRSWRATVRQARAEAAKRLTSTIRREVEPMLQSLYEGARHDAALGLGDHGETDAARALPQQSPYTLDQLLDPAWLPSNHHGLVDDEI
jgi:hypothetical protein